MRDTLIGVIDHHRKLIREHSVSPPDDHITQLAHLETALSLKPVHDRDSLAVIDPKSGRRGSLMQRPVTTRAGIPPILAACASAAGTAAFVGVASSAQGLQRIRVPLGVPTLVQDVTVPREPERLECAEDFRVTAWHDARPVQIFHAHEPPSVVVPRVKEAAYRGDERPEMQ
jgi:hypothetical protein